MPAIRRIRTTVCVFMLLAGGAAARNAFAVEAKHEHPGGAVESHHARLMTNHGLITALQGSNLVILSRMRMAPGLDEVTLQHGQEMFRQGKLAIEDVGQGEDPLVKQARTVIGALEDVIKRSETTEAPGKAMITMQQMHIALNHALEMAADGSNLMTAGRMATASGPDERTLARGKSMMGEARKLWKEVTQGKAMKDIHARGMSPATAPMMGATHRLADAGMKFMDLLEQPPGDGR